MVSDALYFARISTIYRIAHHDGLAMHPHFRMVSKR